MFAVCSMHEPLGGVEIKLPFLLLPEYLRIAIIGLHVTLYTQLFENLAEVVRKCCIIDISNIKQWWHNKVVDL